MIPTIIIVLSLVFLPIMVLFPSLQPAIFQRLGLNTLAASSTGTVRPHPVPGTNEASASASASGPGRHHHDHALHRHEPSVMDVVVTKMMLQQGLNLPPEVVLSVLDFAEYWPHTTVSQIGETTATASRPSENTFIMRSKPLGFFKNVDYDDSLYTFMAISPDPLSEGGEYPLQQFQDWTRSPVKPVEHPCRKIVFTFTSHDQGWGGGRREYKGTYQGSYTWFEAGLERFDKNEILPKGLSQEGPAMSEHTGANESESGDPSGHATETDARPYPYLPVSSLRSIHPPLNPDRPGLYHSLTPSPDWLIQCNRTAIGEYTTHRVEWSWKDDENPLTAQQLNEAGRGEHTGNGEFVRNLKLGDVVTVWAHARFNGWVNHVRDAKIDIYWAL